MTQIAYSTVYIDGTSVGLCKRPVAQRKGLGVSVKRAKCHQALQTDQLTCDTQTEPFRSIVMGLTKDSNVLSLNWDFMEENSYSFGFYELQQLKEMLLFESWKRCLSRAPVNDATTNAMAIELIKVFTARKNQLFSDKLDEENSLRLKLAKSENERNLMRSLRRIERLQTSFALKKDKKLVSDINRIRKKFNATLKNKHFTRSLMINGKKNIHRCDETHTFVKEITSCPRKAKKLSRPILDELKLSLRNLPLVYCNFLWRKVKQPEELPNTPTIDCHSEDDELEDAKLTLKVILEGRAVQTGIIDSWSVGSSGSMVSYTSSASSPSSGISALAAECGIDHILIPNLDQ